MAHRKLKNYLRTHRKKLGLTQKELAFLLSCQSEAKVSRYEKFRRKPNLETALACELIFQVPAGELFAGILEQIKVRVRKRILLLADKSCDPTGSQKTALKTMLDGHPLTKENNE